MAENLILKIEERVLTLLNELEVMRSEIVRLRSENTILRDDHGTHVQKLQGLLSLLEILEQPENSHSNAQAQDEAIIA
jgi:regulator of replication initiation timing